MKTIIPNSERRNYRAMKICHLSSAHDADDVRIYHKECLSLSSAGHHVSLVIADGSGGGEKGGVYVYDVGKPKNRLDRMMKATRRVFIKAKTLNADIFHLHDPEMIPAGLWLKILGKTVVFDAHEDFPKQILGKHYLPKAARWSISKAADIFERLVCRYFDAIVAATPAIRNKFNTINQLTVDINNMPILNELLDDVSGDWRGRNQTICYVGSISAIRGIREMVRALELSESKVRLQLVGEFNEKKIENEVVKYAGWTAVDMLGFLSRDHVREVLSKAMMGVVTFLPSPNHLESQPNKLFEYMSAGIPVIASNFPLWRSIVERQECGLCVDPLDPKAIAAAIDYIVQNPEHARRMGENGRRAVQEQYNWRVEERKLLSLYASLSSGKERADFESR